ncbi:hypothetical protein AJ80_00525 [Polytolypa hystricis UAMH7299]|uniref:3-phytase n=1 Tax=Polytolypa hystricis (strain UAMH7299) TaxID=1447883 RepID=A0A2B7Z3N3_POLH7|nr:hypothetical protein AJ80_00525 [Polytolypa hystricis UAMH7299]
MHVPIARALFSSSLLFSWGIGLSSAAKEVPEVTLSLLAKATGFEADTSYFYYSSSPLLIANDGGAATGGFRAFSVSGSGTEFPEKVHKTTGRSKIATPVYDIGGQDLLLTIASPDSVLRAFTISGFSEVEKARLTVLGDWSTMCSWRSQKSGEQYVFLFGKKEAKQFLVRNLRKRVQVLEVQTFDIPIEGEFCAATPSGVVYLSAEDQPLYSFQAAESTNAPTIKTLSEDVEVAALATYVGTKSNYLFIGRDEEIAIYSEDLSQVGRISLTGIEDLGIEGGLSILQAPSVGYPEGMIALAFEGEDDIGLAIGSLEGVLQDLGLEPNTKFDHSPDCRRCRSAISDKCSHSGLQENGKCSCFAGFSGPSCSKVTCKNNCSSHGKCVGPNVCECKDSWTGPDCSFLGVSPKYETDANGADGDDPAIWISPKSPRESKIITTTKSTEGAGLAVFDLKGKLLQMMPAGEPNNVDVIYGFETKNGTVDLAYAACRDDNTLCLFEIDDTGSLHDIPGGSQPTEPEFEVYGSCAYRSPKSGKQYLFVNSKEAVYLQYELTSKDGSLQTSLVRSFNVGTGGQVEGCVTDEANGYIFLGEEPQGLWRYDAEPDVKDPQGFQVAKIGDGKLSADVEGVTLIPGEESDEGFLLVSSQGISSYLVYERKSPHKYVITFTVGNSRDGKVDHVSNTDGIAAVGNKLNKDFPAGLVVVHDDANELAEGGTSELASFKLISLADIFGADEVRHLDLSGDVHGDFDPRGR